MKWRMAIIGLMVTLFAWLGGEQYPTPQSDEQTTTSRIETTLLDADNQRPTPLLSGRDSSRSHTNNSRRTVQRTNCKRSINLNFVAKSEAAITSSEHPNLSLKTNILGGIVADKAFYSLCCLRI